MKSEVEKRKQIKILSIDGGGIRGLIPAKFLQELEEDLEKQKPGTRLCDHFDMVCGTSTGAILAVGIGLGIPAKELVAFYKSHANAIFPRKYLKLLPRKLSASPKYSQLKL